MKILILSKKFPYPLREGEPIAITYLSRSLQEKGCEVSLLAMNTSKHFFDLSELPKDYDHFQSIHTVEVDNRITILGAVKSFIFKKPYILSRFYSRQFAQKLASVLKGGNFDVIQLETIYLAHYIPVIRRHSKAVVSMRAHNVEHGIWERVAKNSRSLLRRWYLSDQNSHLRKFEISKLGEYDILVAITQRDLDVFQRLGYDKSAVVAPVGINIYDYVPDFECFEKKLSISFIGALDWMPNQEAVIWFLGSVWPGVLKSFPNVELHIAGKNTPDWLRQKRTTGVFFHGEVGDAKAFLNGHAFMVAPLFSGSGIKIKVLEGMALGRVVLTTKIGVEGIPAKHGEHLFVADTPELFIQDLVACLKHQEQLLGIGKNARSFIQQHFDSSAIAAEVVKAYQKLLDRD